MMAGRFGVRFVAASDLPRLLAPRDTRLPDAA